jgi:septum formation protein
MELVLASTSKYRQELLTRLKIPFRAVAPLCDEEALKSGLEDLSPTQLASELARAKAESLRARHPTAWILGSDQLLAFEGQILGKPRDEDQAVERLRRMGGREHELVTAAWLLPPTGSSLAPMNTLDVARLKLRALDDAALRRYLRKEPSLDCAGAYKLEALGIALVESMECRDPTALIGLPLIALSSMLARAGFELP